MTLHAVLLFFWLNITLLLHISTKNGVVYCTSLCCCAVHRIPMNDLYTCRVTAVLQAYRLRIWKILQLTLGWCCKNLIRIIRRGSYNKSLEGVNLQLAPPETAPTENGLFFPSFTCVSGIFGVATPSSYCAIQRPDGQRQQEKEAVSRVASARKGRASPAAGRRRLTRKVGVNR